MIKYTGRDEYSMYRIIVFIILYIICFTGPGSAQSGEQGIKSLVKKITEGQTNKEKTKAAVRLSKMAPQDEDELSLVFDLVRNESDDIDFWTVRTIENAGKPEFISLFKKGLKDADKTIRLYSAKMLGRMHYAKAEKNIIALLEKEPDVMYAQALSYLNSQKGLVILADLLKQGNPVAVIGLTKYGADGLSAAVDVLKKTKPKRKQYPLCLDVIEKTRDPNAVAQLKKLLDYKRIDVARKAAKALAAIKNPGAVEVYLNMLAHQDEEIKKIGERIILDINDASFDEQLISFIESEHPSLRKTAARACGIKTLKKSVPFLKEKLSDEDQEFALAAARALTLITGKTYTITPQAE